MKFELKRLAVAAVVIVALAASSVALAAGGVSGTYRTTINSPAQLKGKWTLTLAKSGTYTVAVNGKALARGRYSTTGKTITFVEGRSGCGGSGLYAWQKAGRTLTFKRKREAASCPERAAVLAHRFTQVR
jgi:hypothetical protein